MNTSSPKKSLTVESAELREAIARTVSRLNALQQPDGHWVGELQGDTILESEYVLLLAFLGRDHHKFPALARYILSQQRPDGAWSNYPGGPVDLSVSVKAYFALKLAGYSADEPFMRRAAELIRAQGGAAGCNSFTKFYLALLGQFPYANCPAVPPELVLLPRWCYIHLYAMSAWTRTILVPLSVCYAYQPVKPLPAEQGIRELFLQPPETPLPPHPPTARRFTWTNFFLGIDALIKRLQRWRITPLRRLAVRRAVAWMRERFAQSDGLGAIFPPMVYTAIVLRCLGVPDDDAEMLWAMQQLRDLEIADDDTLRLQPCLSPVWDTTLTTISLCDAGQRDAPTLKRAIHWLLDREVRQPGDWSRSNPRLEPGGWFFEYRNAFYPDTDDTAMALIALARSGEHRRSGQGAARRAIHWLLGMQNRDGGWAAFDRDINRDVLTKVPFADHNAMLDPSCPDITARVLEALGHYGYRPGEPSVDRAVRFLERTQESFGAWPGRWGVNYLYGTWQVLAGLAAIGVDRQSPMMRRAAAWLQAVQQPDGSWGESCRSYDDPAWAGRGPSTASQTAWALLGLLAAGKADSLSVRAGIDWLLSTQQADGNWHEEPFTGTGFPKVFYLKYHLYSCYFPLMALSRYARCRERAESTHSMASPLTTRRESAE